MYTVGTGNFFMFKMMENIQIMIILIPQVLLATQDRRVNVQLVEI